MEMTFLPTSTPTFLHHADHIALLLGRVGSDDEVRPAQDIDVQRMVFQHESVIDQLADSCARRACGWTW